MLRRFLFITRNFSYSNKMSENCGRQSLFTDIPGLFWLDLRHYFTDQIILEIILTIPNIEIYYRKPGSLDHNNINWICFYWYKFKKLWKHYEMLKNILYFFALDFFWSVFLLQKGPISLFLIQLKVWSVLKRTQVEIHLQIFTSINWLTVSFPS